MEPLDINTILSDTEKKEWAKESLKLFGKLTFRRGKGLIEKSK